MIKIISAVSSNGIIGIDNKLPFHYPNDMKHFKTQTLGHIVIMGRNTFESMGCKPLPKRRNIIITSKIIENMECSTSLSETLKTLSEQQENSLIPDIQPDIWLIGGSKIYEEGLSYTQEIHLTITKDFITHHQAVKFPWINPLFFQIKEITNLVVGDDTIKYAIYERI